MTLTATDLHCTRPGQALFEPVSFSLARGEALILRGPNGVGKTTLLRGLAGLGPAPQGDVLLDGAPLAERDGAIAHTGHLDAIKPSLTVRENLAFWAALSGHGSADAAMDLFDLTALESRPAGRMSAGQKRRLGLARLAVNPAPLWLMDEPTVSLDAANTARLAGLIARHLDTGGMALIATHVDIPVPARTLELVPAAAGTAAPDPFLADGIG